ncbi:MAG: GNAT family N-acetyltransferase [Anaerolineales bacterium]|nr:GNAT family N-acetyltransferase [Anaerolineales bacterium]
MENTEIQIENASVIDAEKILELQKIAYISEAEAHNDFTIPPLNQTIDEIRFEFEGLVFLKVEQRNKIIGSVRGYLKNGTCYIGKLIVHPDRQNRGIGKRLLQGIERRFKHAERYELFTGHKSIKSLCLYKKMGYEKFKEVEISPKLTLIYLQKEPG